MSEEELLKYYGCNRLSEFIDTYLDCETAFDLLRSQFKEIERLKEENKKYNKWIESLNKENHRLHSIINEIEAIIYNNQITGIEARLEIQERLDKVGSDKE